MQSRLSTATSIELTPDMISICLKEMYSMDALDPEGPSTKQNLYLVLRISFELKSMLELSVGVRGAKVIGSYLEPCRLFAPSLVSDVKDCESGCVAL